MSHNQALAGAGTVVGGEAFGGGIYQINPINGPSTLSVVDSSLSDNQAIGGTPVGSFIFGGGSASGGGLFVEAGTTVTFTGSTIDGNQALGGTGGTFGQAFGGAIDSEGSPMTITTPRWPITRPSAALTARGSRTAGQVPTAEPSTVRTIL